MAEEAAAKAVADTAAAKAVADTAAAKAVADTAAAAAAKAVADTAAAAAPPTGASPLKLTGLGGLPPLGKLGTPLPALGQRASTLLGASKPVGTVDDGWASISANKGPGLGLSKTPLVGALGLSALGAPRVSSPLSGLSALGKKPEAPAAAPAEANAAAKLDAPATATQPAKPDDKS